MILWRPVGLAEMALVFDSGMQAFPPRLPAQPIFYPVMNEAYASQIARNWNTKESPYAGYVLRFEITDDYGQMFEPHTVGDSSHRELWIPADRLSELNQKISGPITAERAFFGPAFMGDIPKRFGLAGKDAYAQVAALITTLEYSTFDFAMELSANARTIFLNYPFWRAAGPLRLGVDRHALDHCLDAVRLQWVHAPRPAPLLEDALPA